MANPVIVPCPKGAWTKVATNVVLGQIHNKGYLAEYWQTHRDTGDPVPTDLTEAVRIFKKGQSVQVISLDPIDVYIYCKKFAGSVRVDLWTI